MSEPKMGASATTPPKPGGASTVTAKNPNSEGAIHKPSAPPPFKVEKTGRKERYLKLLIYGTYGSGKTTLAGSAAEVDVMRDVFMINAESGDLSLSELDIDSVKVENYAVLSKVYEFLRQYCKARDTDDVNKMRELYSRVSGEVVDNPPRFRTVIMDTVTEIEAYCMNQLLGVTDATKLDDEVASAEWAEYKKNNTMMTRLVRNFRDLPMHVIIVASEQYNQDETKKYRYSPNLTGKLSKQVQGFFDMVGYLAVGSPNEQGEIPRRLYVQPSGSGKFDAKHRYAKFKGSYFDNPTIGSILKQTILD